MDNVANRQSIIHNSCDRHFSSDFAYKCGLKPRINLKLSLLNFVSLLRSWLKINIGSMLVLDVIKSRDFY